MVDKTKIQKALDAGYTPEQINAYINGDKSAGKKTSSAKEKPNLLKEFVNFTKDVPENFGRSVAGGIGLLGSSIAGGVTSAYEGLTGKEMKSLSGKSVRGNVLNQANWIKGNVLTDRAEQAFDPNNSQNQGIVPQAAVTEGVKQGVGMASYMVPAGGGGAATALGRVGNAMVGGGAQAMMRNAYEENATPGSVLTAGAGGAVTSGVLQSGGEALKKVGSFLKGNKTYGQEGFVQSALDLSKKELEDEVRTGNSLAQEVTKRGIHGSEKEIRDQASVGMKDSWETLTSLAKNNTEPKVDLVSIVDDVVNPAIAEAKTAGDNAKAAALEDWATHLLENNGGGSPLDASSAMNLNKALNKTVQETFGKSLSEEQNIKVMAQRLVSNRVRDSLRKSYPELAPYLDDYHFWRGLDEAMVSKTAANIKGGAVPSSMWSLLTYAMRPVRQAAIMTNVGRAVGGVGSAVGGVGSAATSPAASQTNRALTNFMFRPK